MLWAHAQPKARAAFSEAFELASSLETENQQKASSSLILRLQVEDQRYVVIRSVTRKDAGWAKELTQQMLSSERDRNSPTRGSVGSILIAERLLSLAIKLIPEDMTASLDMARISLGYPASFTLTRFLYQLAEVNQSTADEFYRQALAVYADKPMSEFLYLQAYPFRWSDTLNTPVFPFIKFQPTCGQISHYNGNWSSQCFVARNSYQMGPQKPLVHISGLMESGYPVRLSCWKD